MAVYTPPTAEEFRNKQATPSEKITDELKEISTYLGDLEVPIDIDNIQYMSDSPTAIVISKSIETPGQSVYISGNTRLSAANNGLSVFNLSSSELFFLVGQQIQESGTSKPFDYNAGPLHTFSIQDLSDETSASTDVTFDHTVQSNTILQKIRVVPAETGDIVLKILNGANDIEIAEISSTITSADVENTISLQDDEGNPTLMIFPAGENIKVTSSGVLLKGHTNGSFKPYFKIDRNAYNPIELGGGGVPTSEKFTDLTDTPNDKNVPEIKNVVVNPFSQLIEYKQAELSDNSDVQISVPATGEILEYDEGTSKWVNNEPRDRGVLASYNTVDDFDDWQDADISYIFANDGDIIEQPTPAISKTGDMIIAYNYNTDPIKVININARAGETINGASSYSVGADKIAFFVKKNTDWKFGGTAALGGGLTDLSNHSVTELNDVTDAGSGAIITSAERSKLNNLIPVSEPIDLAADVTINAGNYETYNNVLVRGVKTGGTLLVNLPIISTLPAERVVLSFTNTSADDSAFDIRAGSGDTIGGAFFYRMKVGGGITIEKPASGTSWIIISEVLDNKPCYISGSAAVSFPVYCNNFYVKYDGFTGDITQDLPALDTIGDGVKIYLQNADTDITKSVIIDPNGTETVNDSSTFSIHGGGEIAEIVSDTTNNNWILANLYRYTDPSGSTVIDGGTPASPGAGEIDGGTP